MPFCRSVVSARPGAFAVLCLVVACGAPIGDVGIDARPSTPVGAPPPNDESDSSGDETTSGSAPANGADKPAEAPSDPAETPAPETPDPGTPAPEPPGPSTPSAPSIPMPYRGVNLAGAEFGTAKPGTEDRDYKWPTTSEVDYFVSKGMNTFRIGFMWERLQPVANGELAGPYLSKLDALVTHATGKGATVILNPHNFARYYGETVGSSKVPSSVFADLWRRLALRYKANARVMFNLVNEPHTMRTEQWVEAANAAIAAIRVAGATNVIQVPGNGWTGAHAWNNNYYGTPNAKAMLDIVDPIDNIFFEAHQYLDSDSGGSSDKCISSTIGRERIAGFVAWLRANKKKGFIGEFAGGNNPTCNAAVADMLTAMMEASDVLVGWVWWAAGPWWGDNYPFTLHPSNGRDRPQMDLLLPHLAATKLSP